MSCEWVELSGNPRAGVIRTQENWWYWGLVEGGKVVDLDTWSYENGYTSGTLPIRSDPTSREIYLQQFRAKYGDPELLLPKPNAWENELELM